MTDEQQANLEQILLGPAPDGGLWNGRKVADYLSELLDKPVLRQQGWRILKQLDFRLKVPRPAHSESDPQEQQQWKKKLADEVEKVQPVSLDRGEIISSHPCQGTQQEYPDAEVLVWSQDMNTA